MIAQGTLYTLRIVLPILKSLQTSMGWIALLSSDQIYSSGFFDSRFKVVGPGLRIQDSVLRFLRFRV